MTASSPPSFPNPRPMHASYGFGWSGFPGATADMRLTKPRAIGFQLDVTCSHDRTGAGALEVRCDPNIDRRCRHVATGCQ